ncbi:TusE/DsrC/DsvC family sulfur relay protein [Rhodoblastus sp. 17X3]|uniref:TusE/DsrC/DsvC family sulfur relay protein n=1 Tax=Rhodoblastus sp. 17X3 TaxID=3047026 RepID=UPI0024B6686F|nr:TusE/DsrC/DsvC family sulfur relay protein [Rhodoblastus sp. 17X3]MDI9846545.1 TusE/DsrC/DsvC family sulfur relay protein [Rhodoblastus sp. 17X3]
MVSETLDINALTRDDNQDPDFPDAPSAWTRQAAEETAKEEGLKLTDAHCELIRALQYYYARHDEPVINMRELHDALDEKFHFLGGLKYLYEILPGGPIAQGCRLAGLKAPFMATDNSFGSVA